MKHVQTKLMLVFGIILSLHVFARGDESESTSASLARYKVMEAEGIHMYSILEGFGSKDPEVVYPRIKSLAEMGGTEQFFLLYYRWVEESDPIIRRQILEAVSKDSRQVGVRPDRYSIGKGDGLDGWIQASLRFSSPEKDQRIEELKKYFPQTAGRISKINAKDKRER